jgi:hypothetical protein
MRDLPTKIAWLSLLVPALAKSSGFLSGTSDSKIAKNVLESKGEGYCSVSFPVRHYTSQAEMIELTRTSPLSAIGTHREHALRI